MDELGNKLLEAIYSGVSLRKLSAVPRDSTNWFKVSPNGDVYEFVIDPAPIRQAFTDAGYVRKEWHSVGTVNGERFEHREVVMADNITNLDKYGQMELTEDWHYKLLNILEDVASPTVDTSKTLTAYMPEIIQVLLGAGYSRSPLAGIKNKMEISGMMTGQEWYDRFEKELVGKHFRYHGSDQEVASAVNRCYEAARKAAGI